MKQNNKRNRRPNKGGASSDRSNNRGNSRTNLDKRNLNKLDMDGVYASETNDMSWYNANPNLVRDSASIPFTYPLGHPMDLGKAMSKYEHIVNIPGIMVFDVVQGPGISDSNSSALNVASRNIYSFVRFANSGHSNYDHQDLMIYLLAMDEAYSFLYNAIRAYGLLNAFNPENRYAPRTLVRALGWDYDNLIRNQAQFRFAINSYVSKLSQMAVPTTMPIFQRHKWMFSGIYTDGSSMKSQLYGTRQSIYRTYDETGSTGGKLVAHALDDLITIEAFYDIVDDIVKPIVGSEDMGIMSGDILKAYGQSQCIALGNVGDDYKVIPMCDPVVLSQFNNATILPGNKDTRVIASYDITQDPSLNAGTILYNPYFKWPSAMGQIEADVYNANNIVNLYVSDPKPEDVIEATRLMAVPQVNDARTEVHLAAIGADMIVNAHMYTMVADGSYIEDELKYISGAASGGASMSDLAAQTVIEEANRIATLSKFKYAPKHYSYMAGMGSKQNLAMNLIWEIDNFSVVSAQTVKNMHDACALSLWDVPNLTTKSQ